MTLTREEIEILQEELLRDLGWLEGGKDRLRALCAMAIRSSAGPGERDKNAAPQASPSVAPAVHAGPAVAAPLELSEDQLWTMVRVYHGFKTEAAMVEVVGYSMELHVAKMKEAVNALSLSPATTRPISTEEKPCS